MTQPEEKKTTSLSLQEMHDQLAANIAERARLRDEITAEIKRSEAILKAIKKQLKQ